MVEKIAQVDRIARNQATFRDANEAIRDAAEEYDAQAPVPFVCECADERCREFVPLSLDEYRRIRTDPRLFVTAAGHAAASQKAGAVVIASKDDHLLVRKVGRAGDVAERLATDTDAAGAPPDL